MIFHPRGSRPGEELIVWEANGLQNNSGILIEVPLLPRFKEVIDEVTKKFNDDMILRYSKPVQIEYDVKYVFITTQSKVDDYLPNHKKLLIELYELGARIADEPLVFR